MGCVNTVLVAAQDIRISRGFIWRPLFLTANHFFCNLSDLTYWGAPLCPPDRPPQSQANRKKKWVAETFEKKKKTFDDFRHTIHHNFLDSTPPQPLSC